MAGGPGAAERGEGPFLVRHGDCLVLTCSGSAVGPTYVAGAIEAPAAPTCSTPAPGPEPHAPVLGTGSHFGPWGPGHNTFSHDEDGLGFVVFHAHPTITTRGRCTALRRIRWAAGAGPSLRCRRGRLIWRRHG